MSTPHFHVVLHEPEIPNNTGNIGRTCIATGCSLSLIRPLGFSTSVKACRRAGLDYWPRLAPREFDSWEECAHEHARAAAARGEPARTWFFTTKSARPAWEAPFRRGDLLVFGKETRGLPDEMLAGTPERLLSLPMIRGERSLNLATAVCAAVYEGLRQLAARGELMLDLDGRLPPLLPAEPVNREGPEAI